jgi:hypothetical protein
MSTDVNDLVLVHISGQPAVYARVEAIEPDKKLGWWRIELLVLTIPPQVVTWILEREQIDGRPFSMEGTPMRLERVVLPTETEGKEGGEAAQESPKHAGNVIFLGKPREER